MQLLIYKTNINTPQKVASIQELFEETKGIFKLTVDLEDVDNVLRIEASDLIKEEELLNQVTKKGFMCSDL